MYFKTKLETWSADQSWHFPDPRTLKDYLKQFLLNWAYCQARLFLLVSHYPNCSMSCVGNGWWKSMLLLKKSWSFPNRWYESENRSVPRCSSVIYPDWVSSLTPGNKWLRLKETVGFSVGRPTFKSQLYPSLALGPWESCLPLWVYLASFKDISINITGSEIMYRFLDCT